MTEDQTGLNDRLARRLEEVFSLASAQVAARAQATGLAGGVQSSRTIVHATDGGWQGETEVVILNPLVAAPLNLSPVLNDDVLRHLEEVSNLIVETHRRTLPFWSPFGHDWRLFEEGKLAERQHLDYEESPPNWVLIHVLLPAVHAALSRLGPDFTATEVDAQRFAHEVISVASSAHLNYRTTLNVGGLSLENDFTGTVGSGQAITFRSLSGQERGALLDQPHGFYAMSRFVDLPTVEIGYNFSSSRTAQGVDKTGLASRIICSLGLIGKYVSGQDVTLKAVPDWKTFGTMGRQARLPAHAHGTYTLEEEEFRSILRTVNRLSAYHIDEPASSRDLAFHRFILGNARPDKTDALVDFTVALESLLLPYDPETRTSELSYRFRLHGAHFIGNDASNRRQIFKDLRTLYETRSRLVHGSGYPSLEQISSAADIARELARQGLLRAATERFPSVDQLTEMVLGLTTTGSD